MNPATNPATNPAIDTLHALRDNWAAGGDMGRPDGFVAVREGGAEAGEAYAVKIELWTDDCLMDLKKQDEAAARRRGEALAKKWAKEHWPHTGYVDLGGAEGVYGATWAWDKATENELERTDPDEVVRLPAARSNPEDDTVEKLKEWGAPEAVAEKIAEVVEKVGTCTDTEAMTGKCMVISDRLARELDGMTYVDDYGDTQTVTAFSTQLWDVPKRLQSNALAHGHYVVKVETDSGVLWVDLTAAQFGAGGPGVVAGPRVPAVGDFEPFWEGRSNPPSRKPLDRDLYADVVAEAKSRFDVWPSAYASGWVVKTYKARGGRYAGGDRKTSSGLTKWFGEEWVDLSRPIHEDGELIGYEPCGRKASDDPAAYPKCRPLKEAMRMSPSEVKDAVKRKRAAEAKAAKGRGGRGARAPVRVSTYRVNPAADAAARLGPVVDAEEWDDGTVVEFVAVPFPVERKPLSYKDDPEVSGFVRVEDLIATQRRVTKAGVEKYLDDADRAGRVGKIRVYETHDGRRYIADGHHRAVAAWAAGVEVLPAVIQLVRE